jgi:hypothetical protein
MKIFFTQVRFSTFCAAKKTGSRLRLTAASALLLVVITVLTQVASQACESAPSAA